jgi:hypothetical protein
MSVEDGRPPINPPGWPTGEQICEVFDVNKAAHDALADVTSDEMLVALQKMPMRGRQFVLHSIGLHSAKSVNRGMASQLLAQLRRQDDLGSSTLLRSIALPLVSLLDTAELSAEDWSDLTADSGASGLHALAEHGEFTQRLGEALGSLPAAMLRAGLVAAIGANVASAAMALAFLAVESQDAREAYAALQGDFPNMPDLPALPLAAIGPISRLIGAGRLPAGPRPGPEQITELLEAALDSPYIQRRTTIDTSTSDADVPGELADEARELLADWDSFAEKLTISAASLREGVLPTQGDLADVLHFVDSAGSIVDAAGELYGGEELETSREGLIRAAELLSASSEQAVDDSGWLAELTRVSAPTGLEEGTGLVRAMAEDAAVGEAEEGALAGLRGLHTLIGLAAARRVGQPVDYGALAAAQAAAMEHLPKEVHQLIAAAAVGDVGLPGGTDAHGIAGAVSGKPPSAEPPAHIDRPESTTGASIPRPIAPPTPGAEPTEAKPAETEAPAVDAQSSKEPLNRPAAEPGPPTTEKDPLADLDEMLAEGAAASLAAATGARRATATGSGHVNVEKQREGETEPAASGTKQKLDVEPDLEAHEVEAELLRQGRFGLAADLRQALGGLDAEVGARRLAAYAADLRQATGPLAAAFANEAPMLTRESLANDHAGQLVAWAAAVRIAVLAPSSGSASLITELSPCISDYPALIEVGQSFAEASRSGVLVLPEIASAVGALSAVETNAEELARRAAETISSAPHRSIKYAAANRIYQIWMNPSGVLGELLEMVAENNPTNLTTVRDRIISLRGRAGKSIEETFSQQRHNPHAKIVAGAYTTLINRWDDAVELASSWAQAAELADERSNRMRADSWHAGPLATLRARVQQVRPASLLELAMIAENLPDGAGEGAELLLADAFSICDGRPPTGDDVRPEFAAHGELLATTLPLSPRTLTPEGGLADTHVPMLIDVAEARPGWSEVYAARAQAGDHDLTAALIAALQASEPRIAASLQLRRDADVADTSTAIAEETTEVTSLVNARRLAGALDDELWSSLFARVEALQDPARRDFGRMRQELADITATLETALADMTQRTIARIELRAADSPAVAEAAETLIGLTQQGHIASAEEFLEQVLAGGALPALEARTSHFARFYPAIPEFVASHAHLLGELPRSLQGDLPSALVGQFSDLVGNDVSKLPEARRDLGMRAIRGWRSLAGTPEKGTRIDVTTALRSVLGHAGFEFGELDLHPEASGQRGRQWMTLRQVKGTGDALHPALGSAMSPDGATLRVLLVRRAASPATVVEWMSGEPADHTVLVLWLAGPLTTDDRRAVANAARDRPQPPLLLLDEAVLAYLVCQPEPRRTTFAEITLPFTAMSPYRDTPGDVAQEMFYGRTDEMAAVLDLSGSSILYGGRQLGKSALLRAAERRFRAGGRTRTSVLTSIFTVGADGHPERLWSTLWPRLAAYGIVGQVPPAEGDIAEVVYDGILSWLNADPERALLILLDEADAFLDSDSAGNAFTNVDWCRRIREDSGRRAKFVFAGLHRTARFESLLNQPLSHFGRPVSVGPLRPQHAYELLTRPLAALGFHFTDEVAIPARILALTNNMPALLQLFGAALVSHLTSQPVGPDEPPRLVTEADVDAVFSNADLLDAFREKYVLTLNLDHRYLVIAYAVAQAAFDQGIDATLSFAELAHICRQAWPQGFASCGVDGLRALATECVDLGILATDAGRYRMRTPMVLRLLGTEEEVLEALYSAPERLSMPSISDAGFYRRQLLNATVRSPLTEAQLGQIFGERTGTFIVVGSNALSIERVSTALEDARSEGAGRFGQLVRARSLTADGLRRTIEMLTAARALVIVDARSMKNELLEDLLWTATDAISVAELSNITASVVFIAGPANAVTWVNREDLIELSPLDPIGLRLWCDEDGLPYHDDGARAEVMAVTGGWPKLMNRLTERLRSGRPVASGTRGLDEISNWLSGPGASELADAAGVGGEDVLGKAFASAAALTAETGADTEYLAGLLTLDESSDLVAAGQAAGYLSLDDVVTALSLLGCLRANPEGLLQAEPVLARAVRAATP